MNRRRTAEPAYTIRHNAPEVRVKVTPDLYRALHREAASEDVTVAQLLRRIVAQHYERIGESALEEVRSALAEASAERELLVVMLDLLYSGLLVRVEKPSAEKLEARIADATEGHRKWRAELARHLTEGPPTPLLGLIREVRRQEACDREPPRGGESLEGSA